MPSLEGFGATVVIGACFIAGFVLTLDWLLSTKIFPRIKSNDDKTAPLGLMVLLLALSYATGILIENTSDYVVGLKSEQSWLRRKLMPGIPSEARLKRNVLVDPNLHYMESLGKDVDEAGLFSKYTGEELKNLLLPLPTTERNDCKEYRKRQENLEKKVLKVYYRAKSQVLAKDTYFTELMDIQHRIDFIRSFALGSAYLLIVIVAVALLRLIRPEIVGWACGKLDVLRQKDPKSKSVNRWIIIKRALVLCFIGGCFHLIAISAYQYEEKQFNKRVFGYFLSLESMQDRQSEQIERQRSSSEVSKLTTPKSIEASGVAAFEDHLFIVNDKDNSLYVVNPEDPALPMTMINVPGFPDKKAKFEDICFHADSGYFYVIGAHYTGVDEYQKLFRFKIHREGKTWKPERAEELSISDDIMPYLSKTTSIEGIAVAGKADAPRIFVGIRGDRAGQFVIVPFSLRNLELVLEATYELPFTPEDSSAGVAYHLSGLMALSDAELLVLAASEDKDNSFHGNRVYTFDLHRRVQIVVTQEFAVAQKAEGITTWGSDESDRRFAIVFDNDGEKTKQPSRLLIVPSLSSLHDFCFRQLQ